MAAAPHAAPAGVSRVRARDFVQGEHHHVERALRQRVWPPAMSRGGVPPGHVVLQEHFAGDERVADERFPTAQAPAVYPSWCVSALGYVLEAC